MVRRTLQTRLRALARKYPIVTVTGPRQSGKTTLCRATFPKKRYISLENDDTREYARQDPRSFVAELASGAILGEIQRVPSLFSYLQPEVDERPRPGRFVLTALFESWVAAEVFKACTNRGEVPSLFHFRDRKGGEVDLVLDRGQDLVAIEVKSSQTIASDMLAPLHAFAAQFTGTRQRRRVRRVIVYGGVERQNRSEVTLLPWSEVAAFDWLRTRRT